MPNGLLGTEVSVEIEMMTILEVEVETETIVDLSQGEDVDPASLQMMTQNYGPADSEGEVEYLNL